MIGVIHEHKGTWLDLGHALASANELPGARAASCHDGDGNAGVFDESARGDEMLQSLEAFGLAFGRVRQQLEMSVIALETEEAQAGTVVDAASQRQGRF